MKTKTISIIVALLIIFGSVQLTVAQYEPMENIPGSGGVNNISTFPAYVQAIYKFAVWSVGIAALLMISIGGFMYFTAAGNTSKLESAKKVIYDALYGLIAVMIASLILYKINPDLINLNLDSFDALNGGGAQNTINPGGGSFGGNGATGNFDNNQIQTGGDGLVRDENGNVLEPQPLQ